MNIPSPTITTTTMTPQDPSRGATTTVTLPSESSSLVAPLIEFRNANNSDTNEKDTKESGIVGTCIALADLITECFELVNDHAFAGIIEGKPDEEGGNSAFLGFIEAPGASTRYFSRAGHSWKPKREFVTKRHGRQKRSDSIDRESQTKDKAPPYDGSEDGGASKSGSSSKSNLSSRVNKYFGESPLEMRQRTKNIILEAMRASDTNGAIYTSDASLKSSSEEGQQSHNSSLYTSEGQESERSTFDTHDTDSGADDERTDSDGGDDAPRDGVNAVKSSEMSISSHQYYQDAFPPVVQKFHSLNSNLITNYKERCEADDTSEFDAFIQELQSSSSNSWMERNDQETAVRASTDNASQRQRDSHLRATTHGTTRWDAPLTSISNSIGPIVRSSYWKSHHHNDDDPMLSTSIVSHTKELTPEINANVVGSFIITSMSSSSSLPLRKSFWRPTVQHQDRLQGPTSILFTSDRMSEVDENKKHVVKRNFQGRVKQNQAMIVRQKLAKRHTMLFPASI